MKRIMIYFSLITLIFTSCKKSILDTNVNTSNKDKNTRIDLDNFIRQEINTYHKFEWHRASLSMINSALNYSDNMLSVGYTLSSNMDVEKNISSININDADWKEARQQIINLILQSEQQLNKKLTISDIMPWEEKVLPVIDVIVKNPATINLLGNSKYVRYAEPLGYEPEDVTIAYQRENMPDNAGSSGCGGNTATLGLAQNVDYVNLLPSSKQSWNYIYHNIPKAWSKSTGAGTKVFFIDTGCEFDQENLGSAFNQGSSAGRTIEKIVTLPRETFLGINTGPIETADDGCGHGTAMAGACGAPRGTDGNACGVAYNCNLVTCRGAADVYLDESREAKGVADAFTNAGNRTDVKIISMSMGRITSSSQIRDAVLFAYGKGKLIFCAAGTSFGWTSGWAGVIFPASMSQVNAVTGVRDNSFITTCSDCHNGSETDFTIVMERFTDYRKPLTLAMSGDVPSTIGGSSVATATAAGIAALVYSKFPTYTRDQVLNKLIQTSANYPTRNASLGWGNLNADAATN
jgi:subtilisin family serine protease